MEDHFKDRYKSGDTPWDIGKPDVNLIEKGRRSFAENVAVHLEEAGLWLTLVGSADERRQGPGPPQRSAGDIVLAVEPDFEILSLQSSHFGSNHPDPPKARRCLLQKRRTPWLLFLSTLISYTPCMSGSLVFPPPP